MPTDYAVRRRANEESLATATCHREIWEPYELELLQEGWSDDETTLPEIAELLGRTIEACRQRHYELIHKPATTRVKPAPTAWDRGWTSLEAMGY